MTAWACGCTFKSRLPWDTDDAKREQYEQARASERQCVRCEGEAETAALTARLSALVGETRTTAATVTSHVYDEDAGVVVTRRVRPRSHSYPTRGGTICRHCGGPASDGSGDCGECR